MLQVDEHLACAGDVLVVDDILEHVDGSHRHACRVDDRNALRDGVLSAPLLDLGLESGVVLAAVDIGVEARVGEQILTVNGLCAQERE